MTDPVRLPWPSAIRQGSDLLGEVVHVDRFGNLVTSIRALELDTLGPEDSLVVAVEGREVGGIVGCYADAKPGAMGAILGSSNRLEIFAREGSAQAKTGASRGAQVSVRIR
ncbi:MAG: SAM hydroxide adenosyltransferase [Candidatus Tectimicrobiota bacterium]